MALPVILFIFLHILPRMTDHSLEPRDLLLQLDRGFGGLPVADEFRFLVLGDLVAQLRKNLS